jgi:hypothetical protein
MPLTKIKLPKKTNTQTNSYIGPSGEVNIDTDKQVIVVHDGSTVGGLPLARETRVNASFQVANSASSYANAAFEVANSGTSGSTSASSYANSAYTQANTANTNAATADQRAVTSGVYANAAFAAANAKFSATGGTISGDVTVTGNLIVTGNVFSVEATNLSVEDNMIYLNANNTVTNPDLGFAGNYNDGTYHHTGVFRDASDGIWKFFYNYQPEPDASPYIDTTHASFRIANLTANLITDVVSIRGFDPIDHANSAYAKANTAATAYITQRVVVITDGTTVTMNADTTDMATQSNSQSVGTLTIAAPTGTPSNGQKLIFRLLSTNVQTFSWNAAFQGSTDLALPTTSSGSSKYDYMGFIWNSTNSKWQMLAKNMGY